MQRKHRNRYQRRRLLPDEIANKHKHLKQFNKQLDYEINILNNKVTWIKRFAVTYSINIVMNTYKSKVEATQVKKFNKLYMNKLKEEGVNENSNNTIQNLTTRVLSNEEYQLLRYDLNHGLATYQKANNIFVFVESAWDQINKKSICKETQNHKGKTENSLRPIALSLIDLDNCQVFKDKKKLEIIRNLRKELVILKPGKENGVVLIRTNDCYATVKNLLSDKSKFKEIHDEPTPAHL